MGNALFMLTEYALDRALIEESDKTWAVNSVLDVLRLDAPKDIAVPDGAPLCDVLSALCDDAAERGVIPAEGAVYRELLDTAIMGALTPRPSQVTARFGALFKNDGPQAATDWYYGFSQDTNYIRRDRIARDRRWKVGTPYGELDITINLSKPEKDPRSIAAARDLPASDYPRCLLCAENEGYAGRLNHPARHNHRIIPLDLGGERWYLQYSPYVYYNEHCICFNSEHITMHIDNECFEHLLEFVAKFPHYFIGSNADLPIVGGSILSHDHYQGGHYTFAMEKAPTETPFEFPGYGDITAGIVKWPMSVIRLNGPDPKRISELADRILTAWRGYTDEDAVIYAETDGTPHNTITPIARRRGENYELDLVLRNNLTTEQHPLGLYHPHEELHHIKKENIGLIEVMGLAVLPARLNTELTALAGILSDGGDPRADERTAKHADWADGLARLYDFTPENAWEIIQKETGTVFMRVLEDAGVYKRTEEGKAAFMRFLQSV